MAPSTSTPQYTVLSSAAEAGVDQLWKFQLRKENAVLLEKLEANDKLIQTIAVDNNRRAQETEERITALEAKLTKFESERKDAQRQEKQRDELAAIQAQMKDFREGLASGSEFNEASCFSPQKILINTAAQATLPKETPSTGPADPSIEQPPSGTAQLIVPNVETNEPSIGTSATNSPPPARPLIANKVVHTTRGSAKQAIAMQGPTTRSRRKSLELTSHDAQKASKPLKLSQGNSSLKAYLHNASSIFSTLSNTGPQFEINFVALFIKGLRDGSAREKLVNELQLIHPSKMKKDGQMEILCEWEDVPEALKSAGMVEIDAREGERPPRRKGNILVPRELIEGA